MRVDVQRRIFGSWLVLVLVLLECQQVRMAPLEDDQDELESAGWHMIRSLADKLRAEGSSSSGSGSNMLVEATKRSWIAELSSKADWSDETEDLVDEIQSRASASGLKSLKAACKAMCPKCVCGVILMPSLPTAKKPKKTAGKLKKPKKKPEKPKKKPEKPKKKPEKPKKPKKKPEKPKKPKKKPEKAKKPKKKPGKPEKKPGKPKKKPSKHEKKPGKPKKTPSKPEKKPGKPKKKPGKHEKKPGKPKKAKPTAKAPAAASATEKPKKVKKKWLLGAESQLPDFLLDEDGDESVYKREVDDHDPMSPSRESSLAYFGVE